MADPENEVLRSTFPSYMAEGERLYLCGEFAKAAHSFSNALHLQSGDKNCLVARSKCFLKMGELEKSLEDAEASLQGDPTFCKGILQKAETLYTMGDFEFALVFYHRGYKLRPDREFKVGIQKAQEAINNSVGNLIKGTIKHGLTVEDLIMTGINYLDTRSDFWRQQKPIYARERDRKLMQEKWLRDRKRRPSQTARYILKSLEDIDMLLTSGSAEGSLQKAEKVLKKVLEWNKEEVPNKDELVGNLYSCIGNAQIELGQMVAALQSHRKDLEIAKEYDLPDAKSRALDNIGRVFARVGKFQQAIDTWEEKIPLAKTTLEKTWLFHEIGRCYLELDQAWEAQSYGEKSQQCAEEEGDMEWQLNASVLVAQAQVKLRDFESAVNNFEKALERAKLVHNNEAQQAIINALDDANKGIIDELKKTNYRDILKEKKEKENATMLDGQTRTAKEKETRKTKDEPEKVMKQWEQEQTEKQPQGVLSKETLGVTARRPEERQREDPGKASWRKELGAKVRSPGDTAKGQFGEAGRTEENREETREIYRRPSELDQNLSDESSPRESEGLEKRLSKTDGGESEALGKTESGEIKEMEITENSEKIEKDEKEDEPID
ncbi:outer dynein arm-docking complex subunit 4 isoform X2 [Cervus canadensis]|uniref:outer dynein arm-docking complex subunit 4 isoform X2 n=1 Tax=Cervus canadensis TaxID=1574408 RepID=UPI001C9E6246|nr:outer dynein arm-docking complex subunit 4 isoform X2 [Cervus canadensis]